MTHPCPIRDCLADVDDAVLLCPPCRDRLPLDLRRRILNAYLRLKNGVTSDRHPFVVAVEAASDYLSSSSPPLEEPPPGGSG
jgi:hypothetical protein